MDLMRKIVKRAQTMAPDYVTMDALMDLEAAHQPSGVTGLAQHTPGPWHIEPLQSTLGADMAICAPANGWVVAVIQHDPDIQTAGEDEEINGDNVVWHGPDKANARLIAAAPDLLAALEQFVDDPLACASYKNEAAATGIRSNCDCWACTKTRIARAAIAKARGTGDNESSHSTAAGVLCGRLAKADGWHKNNPWLRPRACGKLPNGTYAHVFVISNPV